MSDNRGVMRQHVQHSPSWPSGWVRWSLTEYNDAHLEQLQRLHAAIDAGLLVRGADADVLAVHITEAGRTFVANEVNSG